MEEKAYSDLQRKHKLPGFKELDQEFDISEIECKGNVLRQIVRKMCERLEQYIKLIDAVTHPEAITSNLYESTALKDEEKIRLFELYKKLMFWHRSAILVDLNNSEQESATYIKDFLKEWQSLKSELGIVIEKLKKSWRKETGDKETLEYFG